MANKGNGTMRRSNNLSGGLKNNYSTNKSFTNIANGTNKNNSFKQGHKRSSKKGSK